MTTQQCSPVPADAARSSFAIEALALLTSIDHLDELGMAVLGPAVLAVGLSPASCGGSCGSTARRRAGPTASSPPS